MMHPDTAARLVLATSVHKAIGEQLDDLRSEARALMDNPGDRTSVVVNGVPLGTVALIKGRKSATVTDYAALMSWALEHCPAAVVTTQTVSSAWVERVKKSAGEWTDPTTGEVHEVPGIGITEAAPTLVVTRTDAASAWALTALGAAMNTPQAITTGEPQ
ncbi:MAG: hypothetical protein ACOH10_07860 [Rhodoglobus sp.]